MKSLRWAPPLPTKVYTNFIPIRSLKPKPKPQIPRNGISVKRNPSFVNIGNIGIMVFVHIGNTVAMEKKMETTISGLGFHRSFVLHSRKLGLRPVLVACSAFLKVYLWPFVCHASELDNDVLFGSNDNTKNSNSKSNKSTNRSTTGCLRHKHLPFRWVYAIMLVLPSLLSF